MSKAKTRKSTVTTPPSKTAAKAAAKAANPAPGPSKAQIPTLQEVIDQGNALLEKQQELFNERWETAMARIAGQNEATVDTTGFDPDIQEFFRMFGGQPLTQMVFVLIQIARANIKTQLLVQAMAAKMAGMEGTQTQEAVEQLVGGKQ